MSRATLTGLGIGVAAGLAAGLIAAPMRGRDMRATLRDRATDGSARLQSLASSSRDWAQDALDRSLRILEQARRAFHLSRAAAAQQLTAPLGNIASRHPRTGPNWEATL